MLIRSGMSEVWSVPDPAHGVRLTQAACGFNSRPGSLVISSIGFVNSIRGANRVNIATDENEVIEDDLEKVLEEESDADAESQDLDGDTPLADAFDPMTGDPFAGVETTLRITSPASEALMAAKLEHHRRITEMNEQVARAANAYEIKKGSAKAAKSYLEELQSDLSSLISEGPRLPDPQKTLPFDSAATTQASNPDAAESPVLDAEGQPVSQSPEWQTTKITDILTLTEKQRERLEEAGIWTIGQFEHVRGGRNPDYPNGLRSIRGIGEKTVDKWEDQIVEWLSFNARDPEPSDDATTEE